MYNFGYLKEYVNNNKAYDKDQFINQISQWNKVYIFGAGAAGVTMMRWLQKELEIDVLGFLDNDPQKHGKIIENKTVYKLTEIQKSDYIFIASTYHEEIYEQLCNLNYTNIFILPFELLTWDDFETKRWLLDETKISQLEQVYHSLEDAASKETMIRTLLYRWSNKKDFIEESNYAQYCFDGVIKGDVKTIIDIGAYNGDTIKTLTSFYNSCEKIYAFEPTKKNYNKIKALSLENNEVAIIPVQKGVWKERATLSFFETDSDGGNNRISDDTLTQVGNFIEVIDLDTYFGKTSEQVDLIKMDIEGAEMDALLGMVETIKASRPMLEVCIYHKINHYADVIHFLSGLNLNYKFYVGHHSKWMLETVLYAIPKERLSK